MLDSNVAYYNKNADSFFEGSINADMSFQDEFDGIWACASLLHVGPEQLPDIMKKMNTDFGAIKQVCIVEQANCTFVRIENVKTWII